ncbi:MAG: AMP-binding protein [Halieaceae bacterium]|jgi:acyl-CoA synthetase (AMP-forming)/AMP-acid ligase II|nr:AMP-binding protein [Halieaceae bacterium]
MRPIDYFDRGANSHPDRIFVQGNGRSYSYAMARATSDTIARALYAAGFEAGDSVAVFSPNDPAAVVCVMSVYRAGGAWVPVNVRNSPASNAEYMAYIDTRWLFFHSSVVAAVEEIVPHLSGLKAAICIDSDKTAYPSLDSFCDQTTCPELADWSDPFSAPDVVFARWPTGGTTGPSKGVEISNRAICTMFELGLRHYIGDETEQVVHLAVAPITHAAGVIICIYAAVGGTTVVLPEFNARAVLEAIGEHRVTHIFLPPTAYYGLLDEAQANTYDTSSLRQILLAAAPVSPDKLKQGVEVFGPVICQCFGQAEAPMLISWLSPTVLAAAAAGDHPERLTSCGQVTSPTRVAILDEAGREVPLGERGEICCRGPLVTPGYYKKPEDTAEARKYGWHHTGDVGSLDSHGYLYIVDRIKDMIITGGFNVFCAEVETPILALPEVLECAVIGVPDEKWGEAIKALVVLRKGFSLSPQEVIDRVRPKLGGVKTPKSVEIWDAIPKTNVGKTDKKALRNHFSN